MSSAACTPTGRIDLLLSKPCPDELAPSRGFPSPRYSRLLYPTPGVAHDNPIPHRYHATVIFGTESRATVDNLLATSQIPSLITQQHTPS
jgi:hypothetical protein